MLICLDSDRQRLTSHSRYADVTHEVKAITSGYRLVLTYNLIDLSQGLQRSAAMLSREKRMLKGIISSWARGVEEPATKAPNFLAYKLDHNYTDASLKFQSLKGLDKVKGEYLREVCAGANAFFYLASMERTVMGSCEDGYILEDTVQKSTELKRMIDTNGSVLAREMSIDEADIVQEDPFNRNPDKKDFEGYTGNEGASATHFYHDTVSIAWRRTLLLDQHTLNSYRSQSSYRSARLPNSCRNMFKKGSSTRTRGISGFLRRCKRTLTRKLADRSFTSLPSL